jgi:MFS family permease
VLFLAATNVPLMVFAMAIVGLSWTATVPLTSALSADIYGRRNLGTIFGMMFAIMPLGSAIGSAGAGFLHDLTGSYAMSIWLNVVMGVVAGVVVLMVRQAPIFRQEPGPQRQPAAPLPAD